MRRALAVFAAVIGAVSAAAVGCSLGLDASLIGAVPADAGTDSLLADTAPGPPPDAARDSPVDAADAGCIDAGDCRSKNPCEVGRCVEGGCVFDLCPAPACQGSVCTALGCSKPASYGFHAATVHVSAGPVGCGGDASRCLAAVYPFVFVGTGNGVVAFPMNDPGDTAPTSIEVRGIPFLPSRIVASGASVYFIGDVVGVGPEFHLAIASLDVPADPLTKSLTATTVFDSWRQPELSAVLRGPDAGLFLINADPSVAFPTSLVTPPLQDGRPLTTYPSQGIATDALPVAASGERVVYARWSGETASFVLAAADAGALALGDAGAMGPTGPQSSFGSGDEGSVLWNAPRIVDDGGTQVGGVRMAWILVDAKATSFDAKTHADVEQYATPLPNGSSVAGSVVAVDATQALVLAAAADQPGHTSVQMVVKGSPPTVAPNRRRTVVSVAVGAAGAAASGGLAYVLANDSPDSCTLHAFAPACDGP